MLENLKDVSNGKSFANTKHRCPRAECSAIAHRPFGMPAFVGGVNRHIGEQDCVIEDGHCVSAVHAEIDMLTTAAKEGIPLKGSTVFSLERPCQRCLVSMAASGVKKVYYFNDYHSKAHGSEFVSPVLMKRLKVQQVCLRSNAK